MTNVTLRLDDETIRRARHLAVERGVSLSRLLSDYMEEMVLLDDRVERSRRRMVSRLKRGVDLGTRGEATWSRDDLHER